MSCFYDDLSSVYHLIYEDWEGSIQRQARSLDILMQRKWGRRPRVVDLACGIGTQSLGLAALGYEVSASDLSLQSIERARREAHARGLKISFSVADMRQPGLEPNSVEAIICCDNALPHLLDDDAIRSGLNAFYKALEPGGLCLLSVRDYSERRQSGHEMVPYGIRFEKGVKYIFFQTWEHETEHYNLSLYWIAETESGERKLSFSDARYYALSLDKLSELMKEVGFRDIEIDRKTFFQPVIMALK